MIVNSTQTGWDVLFQRSHALLAGKLALAWRVKDRPEPWGDVLTAIIDHDDGQHPWQGQSHLTEAGAPLDFTYQEPDLAQAKKTVANAHYRSRWVALLTSMHTTALYEPRRGTRKELDEFLEDQQQKQEALRRGLNVRKAEAETTYRFVFFCDACSLLLCKNEVPQNGNRIEVADTPDQQKAYIFYRNEAQLSIEPWPFEETSFTVSADVFELKQLSFENDQALAEAVREARVVERQWAFQR